MGDVLSQKEIDDLLAAFSSGEIDAEEMKGTTEKQVKNYDFNRPTKFSREHLRTLEIIFEHYGRLLSTHLPAYLRRTVNVEVMNSEAVIYSEFTNALSNPVLLGIVDFKPLEGNIIIELSDNLGFAIVDRMLGGPGLPLDKSRDFSEIELVIIERIFTIITNLLHDPWENVVSLRPRLTRIETNCQFAQMIAPNETVSIITLNVKVGNTEGMLNICIPYAVLEPVIDKLNTKSWYSSEKLKDDEVYREFIELVIAKAKVPIKAILGRSTISVNDFINMQKGDIIKLDTKMEDELNVFVGNIWKFTALPGSSSDTYAVKISSIVREE
ncbi:MAG: flagellar motor switch protein FliM [Lachnospiraceae bacterium]|nr:flagellar motor switch protein FliM [Lachnospiraceae bacterium]MBQ8846636.1 flagellar motor switch protein FliM [Lachnospiraceae bacterium]